MPGLQTIYVDFSIRDPDGRVYLAQLDQFTGSVELWQRFTGTDFDEFQVECEVIAIDRVRGRVYHRPVRPTEVPGTFEPSMVGGEDIVRVEELDFQPA